MTAATMLPRRLAALVALCLPFGLAGCSGSPGSDASEAAPQTRSATESSTFGEGDSATGDAETPEEAIAAEAAGIVADRERMRENLDRSLMLVTALNPYIGYENAAKTAKLAFQENISLKEACVRLGFLTAEKFDQVFHPEQMI